MYRIEDESFAIGEVQRFLLIISQTDFNINEISVDGVYGESTRAGVRSFQASRNLPVTGSVDLDTFNMLFEEAEDILNERNSQGSVIKSEDFPLKLGDSNKDVSILNTVLLALAEHYLDIPKVRLGEFYSRETDDAVRYMKKALRFKEESDVGTVFLERLRKELKEREKFVNLQSLNIR